MSNKATGIVRKIDDLGRVVIPKEIRRTLRIREGDPLEIYTDNEGGVIFKKYSPVGELSSSIDEYAEILSNMTSLTVVICDRDHVVAVAGASKREYIGRRTTPMLEGLMESRKSFVFKSDDNQQFKAIEGVDRLAIIVFPILASGDVCGAVVILSDGSNKKSNDTDVKLTQLAAEFVAKQIE
jgi:AbrB family transcriptional regulator (stage V sporulation protein T)